MEKTKNFLKNEPVLVIAVILALASMLFVHPDSTYMEYIDFRTLGILFCLMAVVAGLKNIGVFDWFAGKLLSVAGRLWQVALFLVMLCFFFSMAITNDVALITFVPLTITVLRQGQNERWIIPVVVLQTIAANLGSMLTPIGNPQNLYLYGLSGMGVGDFIMRMLPYCVFALVLILLWLAVLVVVDHRKGDNGVPEKIQGNELKKAKIGSRSKLVMYLALFAVCLLAVGHILPFGIPLVLVFAIVLLADRTVLFQVDYALLGTFMGFFVFIGNLGRVEAFHNFLSGVIGGHEMVTAVVSSQIMSNVPAALLLSGFTDQYEKLLLGVNLGGLGTMIASMASLISFKYIPADGKSRGKYFCYFTVANLIFLAAELVFARVLGMSF